ncbi:SDR family NAD(P)-dependent oxidoreductase [Flavobacterium rivuli]|uniref:SDR family NAD(P)-dependent oxidoreductase n=1 Tax=Flavobacterium rivuli TaxID=498301 RepID=UPI00374496F2
MVTARNQSLDLNPDYHFIAADLTKGNEVSNLARQISELFGGIDILIDKIGGLNTPGGGFSAFSNEDWKMSFS